MARTSIMAAGGIVLRREQPPRIAVVRLRKRDEWVLPKGKLDDGETPRDAAKREVLEETGHKVTVHEFLGTLVHDTGTRAKVVHYWRMEAAGEASQPLMDDVRAVDWLPLDAAVERLSREHEKTFLETVGPYALAGLIRKAKAKPALEPAKEQTKEPVKAQADKAAVAKASEKAAAVAKPAVEKSATAKKRRSRVVTPPEPSQLPEAPPAPLPAEPIPQVVAASEVVLPSDQPEPVAAETPALAEPQDDAVPLPTEAPAADRAPADLERVAAVAAAIKSLLPSRDPAAAEGSLIHGGAPSDPPMSGAAAQSTPDSAAAAETSDGSSRRSLAQKMRAWLGRAA
ncbi:NUDIX domain-containing protein [Bradyrhizobium sp. STM 3809]|uniref:NUDIX domain-containing protein n=1 Tax=Bradyrhizobium sp. STM 3809 TaxID=551936 RepID=UPI0002409743|nr:NUDIX domain-containing protein [Bradyrhizobium sp. STM 3809]CCD99117.1 putative NUDIX hydrolase [Bradyrhizobium sp. STM 3809]